MTQSALLYQLVFSILPPVHLAFGGQFIIHTVVSTQGMTPPVEEHVMGLPRCIIPRFLLWVELRCLVDLANVYKMKEVESDTYKLYM